MVPPRPGHGPPPSGWPSGPPPPPPAWPVGAPPSGPPGPPPGWPAGPPPGWSAGPPPHGPPGPPPGWPAGPPPNGPPGPPPGWPAGPPPGWPAGPPPGWPAIPPPGWPPGPPPNSPPAPSPNNPPGGGTKPLDSGGSQSDSKPHPSGGEFAAGYVFTIPVGWKAIVTSVANQSYFQALSTEYDRDGRHVKQVLQRKPGDPGKNMRIPRQANDAIRVQDFNATTTMTLKWYTKEINDGSYAAGISVTKVNEGPTDVVYMIKVFDQDGTAHNPDQETTVRFTRVISLDPLNLVNIQGDVIVGLPKALEFFYYFQITDIERFKQIFRSFALPKIVTTFQILNDPPPPPPNPEHPFLGFNVAFSSLGIQLFGLDPEEIGDPAFLRGQMADAHNLGDAGAQRGDAWSPDWDAEYKANIHGIFLVTAYNEDKARTFIQDLEAAFAFAPKRSAIKKVVNLHGFPRPGEQAPNDPFGFRGGGMSNPQVKGVTFTDEKPMRFAGTAVIPMGVLVMGRDGDVDKDRRPAWALDGSLIATRKLKCLVPEFDAFCAKEGARLFTSLAPDKASAKFGARLMGRWKNGTPITMSPDDDAPEIAADPSKVNNFVFDQSDKAQERCPFAAHIRKSNPRNDVPPEEQLIHLIRRHNMPYGPEVTDDERLNGTAEDRGIHFCTYQSSIERGFKFIQCSWYNNPTFPPGKPTEPGWDPLFGQTGRTDTHRYMSGVDPANPTRMTSFMERFIDPRGGEYFFAPSLKTLEEYIAA